MPRISAWKILRSGSVTPLREVDRIAAARELGPRDRALLRRIIGTEVRRRGTLRALAHHFVRGKPSPEIAAHIRIGLVQVFFLDGVPPHAAVSESVRATADTVSLSKGRIVNGVLRNALRARGEGHSGDPRRDIVGRPWHLTEPWAHDPTEHPLLWAEDALSIPAALMKRWVKRFGEERAHELARTYLEEPDVSLRVVRGTREELLAELAGIDGEPVEMRPGEHEKTILVGPSETSRVVASAAFREGRITIQGATAQRAAELVDAKQGEDVLDLCAAPGGKAMILAAQGARVLAVDSNPRRLARLPASAARLEPAGALRSIAMDGASALAEPQFDAALVDAPCSNTGVLGARPGARWRFGPKTQNELAALQSRLLDEAAACVRPGGRLVYSTCSLEPDENEQRVRAFLAEHPGWVLDTEQAFLPAAPGSAGPIDGGFAARLKRE